MNQEKRLANVRKDIKAKYNNMDWVSLATYINNLGNPEDYGIDEWGDLSIYGYCNIPSYFFEMFQQYFDWTILSINTNFIGHTLFERYKQYINLDLYIRPNKDITPHQMKTYFNTKARFLRLIECGIKDIPVELFEEHYHTDLPWEIILSNYDLGCEFISKHPYLCEKYSALISKTQTLTLEYIIENKDKLNWWMLSTRPEIMDIVPPELWCEFKDVVRWDNLKSYYDNLSHKGKEYLEYLQKHAHEYYYAIPMYLLK